ncbi:hypothetical protein EVG20_g1798 [Dentipellis fragilis]|uniref:Uncharacterized protein n=1 Tax=Dentipellis fragilis TaxID=205917 RepID=A0A4Y9ZBM0_9AGAM|nr:hypothetical protein EVG20_g1798 [Dentipellis fragilis]
MTPPRDATRRAVDLAKQPATTTSTLSSSRHGLPQDGHDPQSLTDNDATAARLVKAEVSDGEVERFSALRPVYPRRRQSSGVQRIQGSRRGFRAAASRQRESQSGHRFVVVAWPGANQNIEMLEIRDKLKATAAPGAV